MQYVNNGSSREIEILSNMEGTQCINSHGAFFLDELFDHCIGKILKQKQNELVINVKNSAIQFELLEKLFEAIEKNKNIDSISLISCIYDDSDFSEKILKMNKKLKKLKFTRSTYNEKFSNNLANYINNNENLEAISLSGKKMIEEKICLAINKHKKLGRLKLSYDRFDHKLKKYFSYVLLSRLHTLDINYCYFNSKDLYSSFIKDLQRSNIEKFCMMGNFLKDTEFVGEIFNSLRIGNTVKFFSINVYLGSGVNDLPDHFYEFLDNCKSIKNLFVHPTKKSLSDHHHDKTLGILKKRYGITTFGGENMVSFERIDEYLNIIERNRRFWKNGIVSLKYKILEIIKKKEIEVFEKYPKMLLKYDRTTLVINFENYMNRNKENKEKKRKNY